MASLVTFSEFTNAPGSPAWTKTAARLVFHRMGQAKSIGTDAGFQSFLRQGILTKHAIDALDEQWKAGMLCLESAFNGLAYVCCQNAETTRAVVEKNGLNTIGPASSKQGAKPNASAPARSGAMKNKLPVMSSMAKTRAGILTGKFEQDIAWCGSSMGNELRNLRVIGFDDPSSTPGKTKQMPYHIRRAHPHGYWVGPKSGSQKLIVKWIRSIPVNAPELLVAETDDGSEGLLFPTPSGYSIGGKKH